MLFGEIIHLDPNDALIAFISVFILLVLINYIVDKLTKWADREGYTIILEKVFKELMTLGLISFSIFLYEQGGTFNEQFFESFDVAHMTVFFMAISFTLQAIWFVRLINSQKINIAIIERQSVESLLNQIYLLRPKTWEHYSFYRFPNLFPLYPHLRVKVEFKILGYFFIKLQSLPTTFQFSKYATSKFKSYLSNVGEISPIGWLFLAILICLNHIKTRLLDHYYFGNKNIGCHLATTKAHSSLAEDCKTQAIGYAVVAACFLSVYFLCLYISSSIYYSRLVEIAFLTDLDELTAERKILTTPISPHSSDTNNNNGFSLPTLFSLRSINLSTTTNSKSFKKADGTYDFITYLKQLISLENTLSNREKVKLKKRNSMIPRRTLIRQVSTLGFERRDSLAELQSRVESDVSKHHHLKHLQALKESHSQESTKKNCFLSLLLFPFHCLLHYLKHLSFLNTSRHSLNRKFLLKHIFARNSPKFYFLAIEIGLLYQCFYSSLWATQLLPLVFEDKVKANWILGLTLPLVVTIALVPSILRRAALIETICHLDTQLAGQVVERQIAEINIREEVRETLRNVILNDFSGVALNFKEELFTVFEKYDLDKSRQIDKFEFARLLEDQHLYFSQEKFETLWFSIDEDLSGLLAFEELFYLVFPEQQKHLQQGMKEVHVLKFRLQHKFNEKYHLPLPSTQELYDPTTGFYLPEKWTSFCQRTYSWLERLKIEVFDHYDHDISGSIGAKEFREMLKIETGLETNNRTFRLLILSMTKGNDGQINGNYNDEVVDDDINRRRMSIAKYETDSHQITWESFAELFLEEYTYQDILTGKSPSSPDFNNNDSANQETSPPPPPPLDSSSNYLSSDESISPLPTHATSQIDNIEQITPFETVRGSSVAPNKSIQLERNCWSDASILLSTWRSFANQADNNNDGERGGGGGGGGGGTRRRGRGGEWEEVKSDGDLENGHCL